jgi:hypothetical protein
VTAVVFISWYGPDNLIYNMLTGRRRR